MSKNTPPLCCEQVAGGETVWGTTCLGRRGRKWATEPFTPGHQPHMVLEGSDWCLVAPVLNELGGDRCLEHKDLSHVWL